MIARIRKITDLFFKCHEGDPPQQKISSVNVHSTFFYSEVSPIYRYEMDRSQLSRFRSFE